MADGNDVANAMMSKLYEVLTAGGHAPGEVLPASSFISFIDGGYPFTSDDLAFLGQGALQQNLAQAKNFADIVNGIPASVGTWMPSGSSLANAYRTLFLQNAVVPLVQLTPSQQAALTNAKATVKSDYPDYSKYRNAWQNKVAAYQTALQATPPNQASINKARIAVQDALQDWQVEGNKAEFESALATQNQLQGLGFAGVLETLRDDYDNYAAGFTDPNSGATFAPVMVVPPDFFSDDSSWNSFTFSSQEVDKYSSDNKVSWGGGLAGMEDLFFWGVSTSGTTEWKSSSMSSDNLSVSFEYLRVALDRTAWFDPFLMQSRTWWWSDATPSNPITQPIFSDGQPPPNTTGQWQMIPTDVLFTRNLTVNLDMSNTENQSSMTNIQEQADVKFLIWTVASENVHYQSSSSSYHFQKTDSGIFAPQMQMIAFLCSLMPKEPNPDTSVMPTS